MSTPTNSTSSSNNGPSSSPATASNPSSPGHSHSHSKASSSSGGVRHSSSSSSSSAATAAAAAALSSSSSSSYHHLSHEERLAKLYRHLTSSIVSFLSKAEKAAGDSTKANCKELDDAVLTFLKTRMEWHRLMSHVEAKLQGKAQEMEALDCYVRTQPRLGKRKRAVEQDDSVSEAVAALQSALEQTVAAPDPDPTIASPAPAAAAATAPAAAPLDSHATVTAPLIL